MMQSRNIDFDRLSSIRVKFDESEKEIYLSEFVETYSMQDVCVLKCDSV